MYNYVKSQELPERLNYQKHSGILSVLFLMHRLDEVIATGMDKAKKIKILESAVFKNLQEGLQRRGAAEYCCI